MNEASVRYSVVGSDGSRVVEIISQREAYERLRPYGTLYCRVNAITITEPGDRKTAWPVVHVSARGKRQYYTTPGLGKWVTDRGELPPRKAWSTVW